MLKELRLTNIILIESAVITFDSGFNVLSGETGSGKSAIMNALTLIAGDRSDSGVVRRGAEKGTIEALFDIEQLPLLSSILERAGIDHEADQELLIRREIFASGKSRAFINNQLAQLSLLRQVSEHLFEIIGQHANQKLFSLDYHRQVIDLFGSLLGDVKEFATSWEEETKLRQRLDHLVVSEAQRIRELEICRIEIEELEQANIKTGEEEELFAEYTQLSNSEEIARKIGELTSALSGEKTNLLGHMNRQKSNFEQLIKIVPALAETASTYDNALLELYEVAHTLQTFEARLEHNPERAFELNTRLELIIRLKRKYGTTIEEIQAYLTKTQEKLDRLENADVEIDDLQREIQLITEKNNLLASGLTEQRKFAATHFQAEITAHLRALNMPKVEFFVEITFQKRSRFGDDKIEFFLTPNVGERLVSLRECASGGELSRIMLALQAILAGKEKIPTLIVDEIDANIGGETATVVGEKIKEIASQHQILCITHFPQVAKCAQHHLRIYKQEIEGRTVTNIDILTYASRELELARMHGTTTDHRQLLSFKEQLK